MSKELLQQALDALENPALPVYTTLRKEIRMALAAPMPEPVAWRYKKEGGGWYVSDNEPQYVEQWNDIEEIQPLYTAPPAAPAPVVPLTDEQILNIALKHWRYGDVPIAHRTFARAVLSAAPAVREPQ